MRFLWSPTLYLGALLVLLSTFAWAQATTVHGHIESITKAGEISVDGQLAQITPSTVIMTADQHPMTASELSVGMTVDMSLEDGPDGTDAVSIIASILR
jgi:hypothetical protein